jgi:cytidine deaminase
MTLEALIQAAMAVVGEFASSPDCTVGGVAAALETTSGSVYTGICIDTECSLGFCAEHSAIAEMLKARESEIKMIVAVMADGSILPPCGRCRELIWQVNTQNAATAVIVGHDRAVPLSELLPFRWPRQPISN